MKTKTLPWLLLLAACGDASANPYSKPGGFGGFEVCDMCVGGDIGLSDSTHDQRVCHHNIDDPSCLTSCGGDTTLRCLYGECQRLYLSAEEAAKSAEPTVFAYYGPDGAIAYKPNGDPKPNSRALTWATCEAP